MSAPITPSYRNRVGYQAMLLGGFSTIATALLVMGNIATKEPILERQKEDLQSSLSQVIPGSLHTNNLLDNTLKIPTTQEASDMTKAEKIKPVIVYRGIKDNQVTALAWEISGQGYGGEMRFILALDAEGKILGVRVLSHAETPGLGDKLEIEKDNWILGFNGLSLDDPVEDKWKVKKDGGQFDAFTGATITPRGVVRSILGGLNFFKLHRAELVAFPGIEAKTNKALDEDSKGSSKISHSVEKEHKHHD